VTRSRSFAELRAAHPWRPIRDCPGRFVLASSLAPEELFGVVPSAERRLETALDPVAVATLAGGGLISFHRPDGSWVHTLGTTEGFGRKLAQLGW
jgi:hypothetical protein